jgi:hypothetical protein
MGMSLTFAGSAVLNGLFSMPLYARPRRDTLLGTRSHNQDAAEAG